MADAIDFDIVRGLDRGLGPCITTCLTFIYLDTSHLAATSSDHIFPLCFVSRSYDIRYGVIVGVRCGGFVVLFFLSWAGGVTRCVNLNG